MDDKSFMHIPNFSGSQTLISALYNFDRFKIASLIGGNGGMGVSSTNWLERMTQISILRIADINSIQLLQICASNRATHFKEVTLANGYIKGGTFVKRIVLTLSDVTIGDFVTVAAAPRPELENIRLDFKKISYKKF